MPSTGAPCPVLLPHTSAHRAQHCCQHLVRGIGALSMDDARFLVLIPIPVPDTQCRYAVPTPVLVAVQTLPRMPVLIPVPVPAVMPPSVPPRPAPAPPRRLPFR